MKSTLKILFISLAFLACGNSERTENFVASDEAINTFASGKTVNRQKLEVNETANQNQDNLSEKVVERKLIKNGNISFETDDLEATKTNITQLVKNNNGYISSDRKNEYDERVNYFLSVRIPAENFDNILTSIETTAKKIDNKEIRISDVTEEFLDVETRLKNKKELENRYLEILKKANSVREILDVERELAKLREEIEATEGRLNYLKNQVGFSTLNINFYKLTSSKTGFGEKISDGFSNGFEYLKSFLLVLISLWPFIILTLVIVFVIRLRIKKRKN